MDLPLNNLPWLIKTKLNEKITKRNLQPQSKVENLSGVVNNISILLNARK